MNLETQKNIDRIAELVRQRDAIDRELADMLNVHIHIGVDMAAVKDKTVETFIEPVADVLTTTQPIVRKCGSCGQPGHTWRTCKKDKAQQEAVIEQVDNYDAFLSRGRVAGGEI